MDSVLRVPELARWIYGCSDRKDFIHLALTCRSVFPLAIPFTWENVKGVSRLFVLLREDAISEYEEAEGEPIITELRLPEPLDEKSFSRFNIYAPFVRHLEIFHDEHQVFAMPNSRLLIDFAQTRELLPNLVSLTLESDYTRKMGFLFWVSIFGSRSLLNIQAVYKKYNKMPVIPRERVSSLMRTIVTRCPNVQTLGLFSHGDSFVDDHDLDASFTLEPAPVDGFITQASALTDLICNTSFLEPGPLKALGDLPNLRRLKIHYPRGWSPRNLTELKAVSLLPTAFPQLSALVLDDVLQDRTDFIWHMDPLVAHLSVVEVRFYPYPKDIQKDWALGEFIPLLCERSPHIRELVLEFDSTAYEGSDDPHMCKFSEGAFDAIATLQLTRLEVLHARLHWEGGLTRLVDTWPRIEVLRWPAQHAKPQDLRQFAGRLPRLRHLALEVDMDPLLEVDLEELTKFKHYALQILESGFHLLSDLSATAGASMCWFLFRLLPNAKLQTRPDAYADSLPGRRMDLLFVHTINNMDLFLSLHKAQLPDLYEQDVDPRLYQTNTLKDLAFFWEMSHKKMLSETLAGDFQPGQTWRILPAEALWA